MPNALPLSAASRRPSAPLRKRSSSLLLALAAQAALLALTLVVIVKQDEPADPPVFEGEREVEAAGDPRQRERKLRELRQRVSKPRSFQRLAVENPFSSDLPALPALPRDAFDIDAADTSLFEDANAALAASGLASLGGSLSSKASATEFFGLRDSGERIAIIVNTSASVVRKARSRGVSIEQIQEQVAELVEGLGSGTLFGIVQFSQGARSFAEHAAPALKKNKDLAGAWVREELRGNPKIESEQWLGHEAGFHLAMALRPEVIYLVTDGALNKRERRSSGYAYPVISYDALIASIEREMRDNAARPRIHVVGFELGEEERAGLLRLTRRFGGTLREF